MIYDYKESYSQDEVDFLVEKARNETTFEALSLYAFSEIPMYSSSVDEIEDDIPISENIESARGCNELDRFPIDWEEKAIPTKMKIRDKRYDAGGFFYYPRNNHIEGYIVLWGHGPDLETRRAVKEWVYRLVIAENGLLHDLGIQAVNYKKNPFENWCFDIFFYFTDANKAWEFYTFMQDEKVDWKAYE
ncbi:MAG: hypothetical protein IJ237_05925 [Oscillospiraceae bacterium]|nr:hypothetical protein [Oscillospiraceae bacterium]